VAHTADFEEAILAQQFVRVICPNCKEPHEPDPEVATAVKSLAQLGKLPVVFKGRGCAKCRFTGYQGRTAITELLLLSENIRELTISRRNLHLNDARQTGKWTDGYARRNTDGFSNPANKQNHIARCLIAMYDVMNKPMYKERAEKWWRLMKSRMRAREQGKYYVWNYWDPGGPWDYKADGSPRHWIGVHPNGGYYEIDVEGIVTAFEHGVVFTKQDIHRLIATNRDFMWNGQITEAKFQRIDGGRPDPRWKDSPGRLWTALVPYVQTLRKVFLANHDLAGWGGLAATPWFVSLETNGSSTAERTRGTL
ncbi:MAG: hypothetical protein KAY65_12130, partial [Planctomycetes bacterium]|nr:hypothetical protein [Planctomycetota bacterium]